MKRETIGSFLVPLLLAGVCLLPASGAMAGETMPVESAVTDPGPRSGAPDAGGPLKGLGPDERNFFFSSRAQFDTVDSVSGAIDGETGVGLGPRFNSNFCGSCHAFPAAGGSSPKINPQVAVATLDGAKNTLPSFIKKNGPIREPRFIKNDDGTPDGSVHAMFTITGRSDAPGCTLQQPDFSSELHNHNISLRIPSGLFGLGLVESIPDAGLRAADAAHKTTKNALGIHGHFNTSDNDSTIMRFGWKAQDKSLLMFSGEAYNVEQGVTNELFPNEREPKHECQFNALPEDATALTNGFNTKSPGSDFSSGTVNFAGFARLLAPPTPAASTAATEAGAKIFKQIGCESCHFESQTTAAQSLYTGQSNLTFHPYSDFEVHKMGSGLADNITEGSATGDEFRTAPLWGIGQRLFFLHDGRTANLVDAITAHSSKGSEANKSISRFDDLPAVSKQELLKFLRSL